MAETAEKAQHEEEKELEIPEELPVLPVRDISIRAVEEAQTANKMILLLTQKDLNVENPTPDDLYNIGVVGLVMRTLKLPDGRIKVLVQGLSKASVKEFTRTDPFYSASIKKIEEQPAEEVSIELEALVRNVKQQMDKAVSLGKNVLPDIMVVIENLDEPTRPRKSWRSRTRPSD
jgi:ATP-dependent Lon protease